MIFSWFFIFDLGVDSIESVCNEASKLQLGIDSIYSDFIKSIASLQADTKKLIHNNNNQQSQQEMDNKSDAEKEEIILKLQNEVNLWKMHTKSLQNELIKQIIHKTQLQQQLYKLKSQNARRNVATNAEI